MTWQSSDPCVPCGTISVDRCYHHIYTRKAHPEFQNEDWNLFPCCAKCHQLAHSKGMIYLLNKYPSVDAWLFSHGWTICELTGKLTHD
jgi:hypothetical protein